SGGRCKWLILLQDIGDCNSCFLVTILAAGMGRIGWDLEAVARLQCPGRLTFHRKIKAAFKDIAGFDTRMRAPHNRHSRLYFRFCIYRHITWHRTVHLRQYLSGDAGGRCGRRALRRRLCRNEASEPANAQAARPAKSRRVSMRTSLYWSEWPMSEL